MVTVCSYCLRASCWQGKFYCDQAKSAGVTELPVKTLKKLKLEHPDFWNPAMIFQEVGPNENLDVSRFSSAPFGLWEAGILKMGWGKA